MTCLKSTLQSAKLSLLIAQKSPLLLAYSECRAPSVWSEWWSWVGWGSGLFIVQISSWWSVIWTVCLAFILCSSGTRCWAAVQTPLCPAVKHLQLWSLIDTKSFTAGYRGKHREKRAGRGRAFLRALGFWPSSYIWEESLLAVYWCGSKHKGGRTSAWVRQHRAWSMHCIAVLVLFLEHHYSCCSRNIIATSCFCTVTALWLGKCTHGRIYPFWAHVVRGSIWTLNLTRTCWSPRHKCEFDWCREHSEPNEGRGVKTSSLWFERDSVSTQGCCRLLTRQSRSPKSPGSLKQF